MARVSANEFLLTFLVITDPAPTTLFSCIVTGATKDEFDPTKTLSEIKVLLFSKHLSYLKKIFINFMDMN